MHKRQRIEGRLDETAVSAPTLAGGKGVDESSPARHVEGQSAGDQTPSLREPVGTPKTAGAALQVTGETSPSARPMPTNFIMADPAAKFTLVQDLVKS